MREFLDRHVEKDSDRLLRAAAQLRDGGELAQASEMVEALLAAEPDNGKARLAQAELLWRRAAMEKPTQPSASCLSPCTEPKVKSLLAVMEFASAVETAPPASTLEARIVTDPGDSEARFQLAASRVMAATMRAP